MKYRLGDVCEIKYGKDHKRLADGNIPVYGSGGIMRYADTSLYSKKSVLIPRKGTLENLFFVDTPFWTVDTLFYTQINEAVIIPEFLYYQLSTLDLAGMNVGTAVPSLTTAVLNELEIAVPPLEEQRAVADTLSSLDARIAENRKINHHLEQMAQAIFKSWFVDSEPFGGVKPDNWREGILVDILQSIKQLVKSGERTELPYVPIDTIPMNSLAFTDFRPNQEAQSSLLMFEKNDILIGAMRVYFHRVSIAPFDGITRTTCFILRPRERVYLEYALLLCNEDSTIEYAQNTSKGSTMPYAVWDNGLANLPITIPASEVAQEFSNMLRPIIERLRDSLFEIRHLRSLRDSLLPRLMSGELSVADLSR